MHRFFVPPAEWDSAQPGLRGAERHHCADVLRLKPDDKIVLFDGAGREATARIVGEQDDRIAVEVLSTSRTPPLPVTIELVQAIPKGKTMDLIVQKAVELGATAIHPVVSDRTIVRLDASDAAARQSKWEQVVIEAGKQSGQNWLPKVSLPRTPKELLEAEARRFDLLLIGSLQPDARRLKAVLAGEAQGRKQPWPMSVLILIGPEGDFTPAEIALARTAGCLPLSLGPVVLRAETAAFYALSILAHELR